MDEETKPQKSHSVLILILVIAIILVILGIYIVNNVKFKDTTLNGKFCMTSTPKYLLSCVIENQTIAAVSDAENYQLAISKNNCTLVTTQEQLDIIFCNQTVSNFTTKYELLLEPYEQPYK